uniref:Uncharacterized protein n=1 Tax=Anguilla anguilla TaxID=7936 RepID=A0A0E9Q9C0_ANGAN
MQVRLFGGAIPASCLMHAGIGTSPS